MYFSRMPGQHHLCLLENCFFFLEWQCQMAANEEKDHWSVYILKRISRKTMQKVQKTKQ